MSNGCVPKFPKHKKECCCKQCVDQTNKTTLQQTATATATGGEASNVNVFSFFNKSPQAVYGGDASAAAINQAITQQINQNAQACNADASNAAAQTATNTANVAEDSTPAPL